MVSVREIVAGQLGFEPRQTESESVVLPLHHSPRFLNNIRGLIGILSVLASDQANPAQRVAPFYPLCPGLGKRAAIGLLRGGGGEAAAIPGRGLRPFRGYPAHERVFRGA